MKIKKTEKLFLKKSEFKSEGLTVIQGDGKFPDTTCLRA